MHEIIKSLCDIIGALNEKLKTLRNDKSLLIFFYKKLRIMVLNKGEIVEFDSPENLLNDSKSDFYSMASAAGLGQYLGKNSVTSF